MIVMNISRIFPVVLSAEYCVWNKCVAVFFLRVLTALGIRTVLSYAFVQTDPSINKNFFLFRT